jgi:hypothetical protein
MPATTPPSERGPSRCQERREWTPKPLALQKQAEKGSPEARPIIRHRCPSRCPQILSAQPLTNASGGYTFPA